MFKLALKLFVKDASALGDGEFVPVFHGWIQRQAIDDHLLIDVADYAHVHNGPGTVLVAHQGNFATDRAGGRLGLLYYRKQPLSDAASLEDTLRASFLTVLKGAALLEREPALTGKIEFRTDEVVFRVNDRLLAPNTAETFATVRPALETVFREVYGTAPALTHEPSKLTLFEVTARITGAPRSASALLEKIGVGAAA